MQKLTIPTTMTMTMTMMMTKIMMMKTRRRNMRMKKVQTCWFHQTHLILDREAKKKRDRLPLKGVIPIANSKCYKKILFRNIQGLKTGLTHTCVYATIVHIQ